MPKMVGLYGEANPAYKHGNSPRTGQSKEYQTWASIKSRVNGRGEHRKRYYLDRGITMHQAWYDSFEQFLLDVGKAPTRKHSIDRIDTYGNYEPGNVRWATAREQQNNTTVNKMLTHNGQTLSQEEWGRVTGIGGTNICKRLKRGWSLEKALTAPLTR